MSPEQLRRRPGEIDARSSVYALGVTCIALLTERLPFDVSGTCRGPRRCGACSRAESAANRRRWIPRPSRARSSRWWRGRCRATCRWPLPERRRCFAGDLGGLSRRPPDPVATAVTSRRRSRARLATDRSDHRMVGQRSRRSRAGRGRQRHDCVAVGLASGSIELRDADTGRRCDSFQSSHGAVDRARLHAPTAASSPHGTTARVADGRGSRAT